MTDFSVGGFNDSSADSGFNGVSMQYGWLLSTDFHVLASSLYKQKKDTEILVIESLLHQPIMRNHAEMMGLTLDSFDEEDIRLLYLCLPHALHLDEVSRLRWYWRALTFGGMVNDSARECSRSCLWSKRSLWHAFRSWPRGETCVKTTVSALLGLNRRIESAYSSYSSCLASLAGAA